MVDTRWQHPFTAIVAGPTCSGKSYFVKRFIQHLDSMCRTRFERILFYYTEWQEAYGNVGGSGGGGGGGDKCKQQRQQQTLSLGQTKAYSRIEFREGLPRAEDYSGDNARAKLLVLDDLMRESSTDDVILDLFTRGSHHKNISVIFVTQNVFRQGRGQRDISLNCKYLVLFKNPRDRAQIQHLARQVSPEDPKFLQEAYLDATRVGHSYLLLDLAQSTPDDYRYRTNIFPDDAPAHYVYVPNKRYHQLLSLQRQQQQQQQQQQQS